MKTNIFVLAAILAVLTGRGVAGAAGFEADLNAITAGVAELKAGQPVPDNAESPAVPRQAFPKEVLPVKSQGRSLTGGEIAMLRPLFQDAVDYSAVRVYRGKWSVFQPDDTIMSPDGNIYYPPAYPYYSLDYSAAVIGKGIFVHEMTHVYQRQQGINMVGRRLMEGGVYEYEILPKKDLNDYTLEQQAEIVSDYYLCRLDANAYTNCEAKYSPAIDKFLKNPSYLRRAEKERLALENAPQSAIPGH